MVIIGIDCATQPNKTGVAMGYVRGRRIVIQRALCASKKSRPATLIAEWIREEWAARRRQVLLALDAPLGWPDALSRTLARHEAGRPLTAAPDEMFHRATDDDIERRLDKRPFEVGANLIARTAHAALSLISDIGDQLETSINLAWSPKWKSRVAAIEVYPAATRLVCGVPAGSGSLERLADELAIEIDPVPKSEHACDAIVCVLAGADFLRGNAVGPTNDRLELAKREGWIWARRKIR